MVFLTLIDKESKRKFYQYPQFMFVVNLVLASFFNLLCLAVRTSDNNYTIVTGMWNLGRGEFATASRGYQQFYLSYFKKLLPYDGPMIIFGTDTEYQYMLKYRPKQLIESSTIFVKKQLKDFEKYWYTQKIWKVISYKTSTQSIQKLRFQGTPQYGLKMYNPVVMSKHRLIMQAAQINHFNTEYQLWADGGIMHIFPLYFLQEDFFNKIFEYYQPTWIIQTGARWDFQSLGLGFKDQGSAYIPPNTRRSAYVFGNWAGGRTVAASTAYHIYENLLRITLQNNDMNTDESLFILLVERYPYFFQKLDNAEIGKWRGIQQLQVNQVSNIELPVRTFKWNQAELSQNIIEFSEGQSALVVQTIVQLKQKFYFIEGKEFLKYALYIRIGILIFLALAVLLVKSSLFK